MEPGPPKTKRPRLSTGSSWSNHGVSLPHPTIAHHQSVSGPHHPVPPPPYQQPPPPPFSRPSEPPLPSAHHHHDDRRHHDHDPYPPIQDSHRQLPPSPAHPHYSPYHPREPVVKRDPGEESSLPQLRRPNSTGNVTDGLPPTPHGPPHPSHQHPDDPRRHMSFDNGPPMPHSPALYRPHPTYHPPPTPVAQHPQYEGGHVYGAPAPMYPTLEIQAAASAKRKAQRASQACDSCRQLKAKCDETKPCKNCREKNVECKYRDPPAKQPDKVTADILELLASMKEEVTSGLRKMDSRLTNVEASLRQINQGTNMKVESIEGEDLPPDFRNNSPAPTAKAPAEESLSSPGGTVADSNRQTVGEAEATLRDADDEDMEDRPGPPPQPGKPAMPLNHTTLAGLLLTWPSIESMVQHLLAAERIHYVEEFPIRQEQQRGMLRIFGRGEGFDQDLRASDKGTPQEHTMTDIGDESYSDSLSSPSPLGEVWGQVGAMSPPPGVEHKGGVLNVDGNPDWNKDKVWSYVESFKENILNMHPIIIPKELDALVTLFLQSLPKSNVQTAKVSSLAKFVNNSGPSFPETGTKRKRSPAADEQNPSAAFQKPGRPYRSVHHALVLLVLALGKICLHKDKIPDVVQESDAPAHNSPSFRNGVLASPLQGSPPSLLSQPQTSGLPSPKENERIFMSRRSSLQGAAPAAKGTSHKRNIDTIPGLEYFALATDIIGSHVAGFNLKHVYVHILAGLYHGQLGRVLESWSYINLASRTLNVILRPSLGRLARAHEESIGLGLSRRDNQLAFAFWTCLQLESDILAELPLPQSGLLAYEERMPYPDSQFAINQGFSEHVCSGYLAQLYLRKQLNRVHNLLYDPDRTTRAGQTAEDSAMEEVVRDIQRMLGDSRDRWVPPYYQWHDEDPPANDILSARLRAKYWGSQVILFRPFLRTILEREALPPTMYSGQPPPRESWSSNGIDVGSTSFPSNIDPRTLNYARLAVCALIESTRAFHGMDPSQRIIITNVFGTAHAQWGNLLTLAACYKDEILGRFINGETLSNLFARTISFFRMIVTPTSALTADMNILIGLAKDFGFMHEEPVAGAHSSFSSMASGGPLPPMHAPNDNYNMHSGPLSSMGGQYQLPPLPPHSRP